MSEFVPEGWSEVTLGSVSNIIMGQSPSSDTYNDERNGLPFFQGKADFGNRYPKVRVWCSTPIKIADSGSILFSVRAPVGDINLSNHLCCIGRGLAAITGTKAVQDYLYQKILFTRSKFKLASQGSTFEAINGSELRDFKLVLPPLPEQKKIAAILTSVDDVIEKTQAQIDKLKDLKTGMMQELLTRGVGVDGKPHMEFKDSPVGRIPKGWDVQYLADCCSKMTNGYVGSTRDIYVDKGVDYVLCQNVRPNFFVEKTHKYVRQEFHQKNIRACLQEGDVLTVQTGAGNGDTCVVPKSYEGANCHALIISRPKTEILNPYFLAEYMNSDQGKRRVNIIATGGAHPHLNTTDLRKESIPLPPIEEQNQIVRSLQSVQKKYTLLEERKRKLEGNKKALMQDLLTGKVRVKADS